MTLICLLLSLVFKGKDFSSYDRFLPQIIKPPIGTIFVVPTLVKRTIRALIYLTNSLLNFKQQHFFFGVCKFPYELSLH